MIYNAIEAAKFKNGDKNIKCMLNDNCQYKASVKSHLDNHTPSCKVCNNKVKNNFNKFIFNNC